MKKFLIPEEGQFYKANLHCHSTISDGDFTPEELKEHYKANGYSIIAYTDHNLMLPHPELADENFLPLNGFEIDVNEEAEGVPWDQGKCCHICYVALEPEGTKQVCWHRSKYLFGNAPKYAHLAQFDENEPDYERKYSAEGINDMIRRGVEGGFFVTYNHPTWSREDYRDYMSYHGMHAMEIVNYDCLVEGYDEYNPRVYDDMLRGGERIYCIATDDNHKAQHRCGGFTMIKAPKLEYRTITKALEAGHFYASQGPEIYSLWMEGNEVHIVCSPAVKIAITYGRRQAYAKDAPAGETVTEAVFTVTPNDGFFRLTVTDETGKHANTNAYFIDEWL